jgi:hypothetical protein
MHSPGFPSSLFCFQHALPHHCLSVDPPFFVTLGYLCRHPLAPGYIPPTHPTTKAHPPVVIAGCMLAAACFMSSREELRRCCLGQPGSSQQVVWRTKDDKKWAGGGCKGGGEMGPGEGKRQGCLRGRAGGAGQGGARGVESACMEVQSHHATPHRATYNTTQPQNTPTQTPPAGIEPAAPTGHLLCAAVTHAPALGSSPKRGVWSYAGRGLRPKAGHNPWGCNRGGPGLPTEHPNKGVNCSWRGQAPPTMRSSRGHGF